MRILLVSDVHLDSLFAWAKPDVARRRRTRLDGLPHGGREPDTVARGCS